MTICNREIPITVQPLYELAPALWKLREPNYSISSSRVEDAYDFDKHIFSEVDPYTLLYSKGKAAPTLVLSVEDNNNMMNSKSKKSSNNKNLAAATVLLILILLLLLVIFIIVLSEREE